MTELSEADRQIVEHVTAGVVDAGEPIGRYLAIHAKSLKNAQAKLRAMDAQRRAQERVVALRTACIEALRATGLPE